MTTKTTTTKQAALTIETPFGTAVIRDMRSYDTHPTHGTRADVSFEKLTVNRKEYERVSGSLDVAYDGRASVGFSYYQGLTDSARSKLSEYFCPEGKVMEALEPYTHELDHADLRAALKRSIRSRALSGLSNAVDRGSYEEHGGREFAGELLDEVLIEVVRRRQNGESFIDIYLNDEK